VHRHLGLSRGEVIGSESGAQIPGTGGELGNQVPRDLRRQGPSLPEDLRVAAWAALHQRDVEVLIGWTNPSGMRR
jgi:hypothetical protein